MKISFNITKPLLGFLAACFIAGNLASESRATSAGKIVYVQASFRANGTPYGQISIINPDGTGGVKIIHPDESDGNPALSPDGTKIAFSANLGNGFYIYLMNPDGTGVTAIPNTLECDMPAWSPDGTKIVANSGFGTLATFNVDGSGFKQITPQYNPVPFNPAWSPDGTKIAFDGYTFPSSGNNRMYVVSADGSSLPVKISIDPNSSYRYPSWSPDGQRIACNKSGAIYLLGATNGAETRVMPPDTVNGDNDGSPSWSPDGTQLVFQSRADLDHLAIVNIDGSNRHQLTGTKADSAKWSPARILPRITSEKTAEAIVGQHFAYHIIGSFFDSGAIVTYSATGLPLGFTLDSKTGVISAVPNPGTETTTPISITLNATDGTVSAAAVVLALTIGDGVPVLTVADTGVPSGAAAGEKVLAFAAKYPGQLAGRSVFIEANEAGTWHPLLTGLDGHMTYDETKQQYVLNSTNYPLAGNVSFRARVTAGAHDAPILSNVVGPFNLASSKLRAGQTAFRIIPNGVRGDLDFRATQVAPVPGVASRVQSSTTPSDESSWTDLTNPTSGHMTLAPNSATRFSLLVDRYPAAKGIYFRAVASAPGSVDSLSNLIGPYTLVAATPPVVTITSPAPSGPNTGQDANHPILLTVDGNGVANFNITVSGMAASNRSLKSLSIFYDGSNRASFKDGNSTATLTYHTDVLGVHVIEAVAVDDLNATGRGGTGPVFVRIAPASASAVTQNQAKGSTAAGSASTGGKVFTLVKDGLWTDPAAWADAQGNSGVPGVNDLAIISSSTVTINGSVTQDIEVGSALINGGHISVPANSDGVLRVDRFLTISSGSIDGLHLQIPSAATCLMMNDADFVFTGTVSNSGTWKMHGRGGITGLFYFANTGTSEFQMPLIPSTTVAPNLALDGRIISTAGLDASGLIHASLITQDGGSLVSHDGGTLVSHDGGTLVSNSGGTLISDNGIGLVSHDGGTLITQDGGSLISQDGGSLVGNSGGTFKVGVPSSLRSSSNSLTATTSSGFTQNGGETDLSSIHIIGPVTLNAGVLSGSGIIIGNLTNNGGYISPGHSAGFMAVTGSFTQGSGGTLLVEAAGGEAGQFDRLQIGGGATLGGKLDVKTINGYTPLAGDPFNPLGYKSATGSFSSSSNVQVSVNATGIITTLDPAKPNPSTGQPLNIATRMSVQTGDNVLIAGFIVTGPSGSTKKVLIRGMGPSLAQFGVAGTLSDPFLELHKPDGSLVSNDNWQQGDTSQIPNGFAPSDPRESVLVATLTPGNYSAVVKGAHGETGVGIAELYDLDTASPAKLANISSRGFINTGDDVMIGGFIIGGNEPAKILVRAVGPTLTDFGVQGALADPTLELHDSNGSTISNDDWRETQESEITATTIPPNKDREPAILATLVPGNYTAVVRGKNNTTGVGLVEAYNLQ